MARAWADYVNGILEHNGHTERIDHRSYERQRIDQIQTIRLGVAASQMEKRGIRTERGNLNGEIEVTNANLRQLKPRFVKLQNWLKEESANTEPPTLADYIQDVLSRKVQAAKSQYSQSLYNLKDAANMLNFLTRHKIMDMAGLDDCFRDMIGRQRDIGEKLNPIGRNYYTLKDEVKEAEQIRKSVYSILRQEQREQQPRRARDVEL